MTYAVRYSKIVIIEKVLKVSDESPSAKLEEANVTYFEDFDSACEFALSLMEARIDHYRQKRTALVDLLQSLETNNSRIS